MARSYALNKISKQTANSFKKVRKGAKYPDGKPVPEKTQIWHAGRIAGLKTAKSSYFAGVKVGRSQGRKSGYRSGLRNGRMFGHARRFGY